MKILSLSLDNSTLNKESRTGKRAIEYGRLVEKYTVIVPNKKKETLELSDRAKVYGITGRNKIFQLFNIYHQAQVILKSEKYNLITVQDTYYLALLGFVLARKNKIGLELQVRGFEKFDGIRKYLAFFVIPKADSIKTISQRLKKTLLREFKVKEDKIIVAPIYTEIKNVQFIKKDNINDKFIFIYTGRLVEVKNIKMQIEAVKDIIKDFPRIELWIVGDGPLRSNLETLSKELNIEDKVKFLGWRENLDEFYGQADVFLLTSNSEGWGKVVIEAGTFGLPIIMTDVGCAGEIIKDDESGIVIPVGDKARLKEAMIELIKDNNKRERLGVGARKEVEKRPSKEDILNLYLKSWEKAIRHK